MIKQPRFRDAKYLGALHDLPCLRCGSWVGIEAAHIRLRSIKWEKETGVRTGAGGAEKPSDRWALPLCSLCHRMGKDAEHVVGTVKFYRDWGVDPHEIADALYRASDRYKTPVGATSEMKAIAARVLYFDFGKLESAKCAS